MLRTMTIQHDVEDFAKIQQYDEPLSNVIKKNQISDDSE